MTKEQAYEQLELPLDANLQTVREKFQQMHNQFLMQIDGVSFNPGLKQKKEAQLEQLKEAFSLISGDNIDFKISGPYTGKTFEPGKQEQARFSAPAQKQAPEAAHEANSLHDTASQSSQSAKPTINERPTATTASSGKNQNNGRMYVLALLILLIGGFTYYWQIMRPKSPQNKTNTAEYNKKADTMAWTKALQEANEANYTAYIKQHPKGLFIDAAIDSLTRIKGAGYAANVVHNAKTQNTKNTSEPAPVNLSITPITQSNTSNSPKNIEALFKKWSALNTQKRYTEVIPLLKEAVDLGDPRAKYLLAVKYINGEGVPKNKEMATSLYKLAVKELKPMADQGDPTAQTYLGHCYYFGSGTDKKYSEALKWYRKGADQGDLRAQNNLGAMYKYGQGVKKNNTEALRWFTKAADQGDAMAQRNVAQLYENNKKYETANRWYMKAANQGDAESQYNLGIYYDDGWGTEIDWEKAVYWYRKSANNGYVHAKMKLGEFYMFGVGGVTQNKSTAKSLFREAANGGNQRAKSYLAVITDVDNNKIHYLNTSKADNKLYMTEENIKQHTKSMPWVISKYGSSWQVGISYEASSKNEQVQIWPLEKALMTNPAHEDVIKFTNYSPCAPLLEKSGTHFTGVSTKNGKGYRGIAYMYVTGIFKGELNEELKIKIPYMVCWKPKNAQ